MPRLSSIPSYELKFGDCDFDSLCSLVADFVKHLGSADPAQSKQLNYIAWYLVDQLNCSNYVCETHYIDKDYMDDFAGFYARSVRQYPNYCWRVHFFASKVDETTLMDALREVKNQPQKTDTPLPKSLVDNYRGYVVLRPHPKAFIAKSVLCPPSDDSRGQFKCCRRYETHLAGIPLALEGIAFQQQDRTHSACATAAAWAVLQKSAYDDDLKTPSPREITEAATRYFISGRPVPNQGLTTQQLCEAIRSFGLAPELYKVEETPDICKEILQTYLHSGVPVIAALTSEPKGHGKGHAVAVVGYKDVEPTAPTADSGNPARGTGLVRRGSRVTGFYVHDDRIGPYVPVEFVKDSAGRSKLKIKQNWSSTARRSSPEEWFLLHLIVPVYPKIRLDPRDIIKAVDPIINAIHKSYPDIVMDGALVQIMLMRGTDYTTELLRFSQDLQQAYTILSSRDFPRYVWIVRVSKADAPLLDFICDPTDSRLGSFIFGLVLYGVCWQEHKAVILNTSELGSFPVWFCP